jgi:hypothetical protein
VLGGGPPAFHDLPRLEYAGAIIAEALRAYLLAYAIGRSATASALVWMPHLHCDDARLRASVGSTEAAKDVVARVGVVGPKRANGERCS